MAPNQSSCNFLAVSAEETRLVSAVNEYSGGPIFTSSDSGATWASTDAPITNWTSVACSADGTKLVAVVGEGSPDGGLIYTAHMTPAPTMAISNSDGKLMISWLIPSEKFELQQSASLTTPNWSSVELTPILNLTNLHYEVVLPPGTGSKFYRLAFLK